jgi:hypothetical protein
MGLKQPRRCTEECHILPAARNFCDLGPLPVSFLGSQLSKVIYPSKTGPTEVLLLWGRKRMNQYGTASHRLDERN